MMRCATYDLVEFLFRKKRKKWSEVEEHQKCQSRTTSQKNVLES